MNDELKKKIVNKQFEMIGEKVKMGDLGSDRSVTIIVNKKEKRIPWYEYYKFKSYDQYMEWREWALIELTKEGRQNELDKIDMLYGFNFPLELDENKKGQLTLAL